MYDMQFIYAKYKHIYVHWYIHILNSCICTYMYAHTWNICMYNMYTCCLHIYVCIHMRMCICMHIHLSTCIHMCVYVCIYICIHMYRDMYIYICIQLCIQIYIYVCIYTCAYITHMCTCTHIHMYTCVYVCMLMYVICVHIHIMHLYTYIRNICVCIYDDHTIMFILLISEVYQAFLMYLTWY